MAITAAPLALTLTLALAIPMALAALAMTLALVVVARARAPEQHRLHFDRFAFDDTFCRCFRALGGRSLRRCSRSLCGSDRCVVVALRCVGIVFVGDFRACLGRGCSGGIGRCLRDGWAATSSAFTLSAR